MDALYTSLALLLAALVAFLYLLAPLGIRASQHHQQHPTHRPVQPGDVPDIAADGIRRMLDELLPLGFELTCHTFNPKPLPNCVAGQLLFLNRPTGDIADAFYTVGLINLDPKRPPDPADPSTIKRPTWTFIFRTRYQSGREVATACLRSATIFPRNPDIDFINPHWITSPAELYRIHRARVERADRGPLAPLPAPGQEIPYLDAAHTRELQRVVHAGYYWLDAPAALYRPTLKGAYIMTWRLLPPLNQLRRLRTRLATQRELRNLHQSVRER